jgi:eukaryotic-like serine/threonine-protein kinase
LSDLLAELKRRQVFRAAALYAAVAFVTAQVAALLLPALLLPEWGYRLVIVLLILGFPVAVVLAWAYDLTPDGVVRVSAGPAAAPARQRTRAGVLAGVVLAVVLGASGGVWWLQRAAPPADDAALRVLAVLPFEHIAVAAEDDHFAAGMRAEILSQLSKIADLRLMSPAAIAALGDAPDRMPRLVTELGVGSVVEGSVRVVGGRVRIDVQLTEARSGRTLWAEQYDRDLADVLAVQTDVALRIAGALRVRLSPLERERLARPATDNPLAYELFLRGLDISGFTEDGLLAAVELYRQAIRIDPRFALAHAHLGHRYHHLSQLGAHAAADSGMAAVDRALAVDSTLAFAHFARGQLLAGSGRHAESRLAFLRALELDPNEVPAMADLSLNLARAGRLDESLHWAEEALKRAPNLALTHYHVGVPLLALGDDAATERFLLDGLGTSGPGLHRVHTHLAWLDAYRGRATEAHERVRALAAAEPRNFEVQTTVASMAWFTGAPDADSLMEALFQSNPDVAGTRYAAVLLRRRDPARAGRLLAEAHARATTQLEVGEGPDVPMELARIHALRGEADAALEWLRRAYDAGYRNHRALRMDPVLAPLRDAPGFRDLEAQMEADVARMRAHAMTSSPLLRRLVTEERGP